MNRIDGKAHIAGHGQPRHERIVLEDDAAFRRQARDFLAADSDLAFVRFDKPRKQ